MKSVRLRIYLTGVGGRGTLLASRVLGEAALAAGYDPLVSATHGMAQRGGIVVSTVVLGDLKSPVISPGEADIVLGFEALEAFRALDHCHESTLVIANTAVIPPYPVAIRQAQYPSVEMMFDPMAGQVGGVLAFDAGSLARGAGSPLAVNMVLLGALAAATALPFTEADLLAVVRSRTNPKYLEANQAAFAKGREAVIVRRGHPMYLNNSGDRIRLISPAGSIVGTSEDDAPTRFSKKGRRRVENGHPRAIVPRWSVHFPRLHHLQIDCEACRPLGVAPVRRVGRA